MSQASERVDRLAATLRGFFSTLGHVTFWIIVVVLLAETISAVALGFYYGAYLRLPVIAPGLPSPRGGGDAWFSLRPLLYLDLESASPAYEGQAWAEEFWKESRVSSAAWKNRYEPFRVWGNMEWNGKYINVDRTEFGIWRRTANFCGPGQRVRYSIWFFGGSTVLGGESPDFATLPSHLAGKLNQGGKDCAEVINFGVEGYVINQEVILLIQLLKSGKRPNAVIFYDGANDAYAGAYSPGLPSAHHDLLAIKNRFEQQAGLPNVIERSRTLKVTRSLLARLGPPRLVSMTQQGEISEIALTEQALSARVSITLENYEANVTLIKSLGKAYGFESFFFWQPLLAYGDKFKVPFEESLLENRLFVSSDEIRAVRAVYVEAEARSGVGKFVFLGRLFDQIREPIYVDWIHMGSRGNEIVAHAIAETLTQSAAQRD